MILLSIFLIQACKKSNTDDAVPSITYLSLLKYDNGFIDTSAVVSIYYEDANGDLGTFDDGTQQESNFICKCYEKKNDVWNFLIDINAPFPNITPTASNKSIDGTIDYLMNLPPNVNNDTLRYELYIKDRAGNKSNTITTDEIVVTTF